MAGECLMVMGYRAEDGTADYLLCGLWTGAKEQALARWGQAHLPPMDDGGPSQDFHRLQVEYWLWSHREQLQGSVMDVGQPWRRSWAGDGYFTFGMKDADEIGDLLDLQDYVAENSLDAILCTEVLEHCEEPWRAVRQMHWALKPGGLLLVTSPFVWPYHGIPDEYPDYWRFTHEGWRLLLRWFADVKITECAWTDEGAVAYDMLRRWEGMGFRGHTRASTGYLCSATKAVVG
jgi:SAM-dependent methyltransferase